MQVLEPVAHADDHLQALALVELVCLQELVEAAVLRILQQNQHGAAHLGRVSGRRRWQRTVTTPTSRMTWSWLNCAMIAASSRKDSRSCVLSDPARSCYRMVRKLTKKSHHL
jgi:hypothetical protein